jgi:hypothetical protein
MATPTRTIGPLHLEDLEPHRFEDLVRQLVYDFRNWGALEATGRAGSDDGFDARAFEVVPSADRAAPDEADGEEDVPAPAEDRVWLVQCKREKTIPPKKLLGYLDALSGEAGKLHGIIFAAACDFSKAARDAFRQKTRELGFAEAYLWGKAEIEDMLFQPKNDYLLFAYFGVSLQTRRRSLRTEVRSRLAMKRKAMNALSEHQPVLIRDASDDRYPYLDEHKTKTRLERGRWKVFQFAGCHHDGLHFVFRRHCAYLADDGEEWDYAEGMNEAVPYSQDDPWTDEEAREELRAERVKAMEVWEKLPEQNRAWFEIFCVLPYENVLDIDKDGDDYFEAPHVYTTEFQPPQPFRTYNPISLRTIPMFGGRHGEADGKKRVKIFPRQQKAGRKGKKA